MELKEKADRKRLKQYKHIILLIFILAGLWFVKSNAGERFAAVFSGGTEKEAPVIVIDAGHGGVDPGKVGKTGALEKEINLSIALKLQKRLEEDGVRVVLTRDRDMGLYSENAQNKKREEMEARVRLIAEANPEFVISIHQNSYPAEECTGAQMFYYKDSEESKRLAEMLQSKFPELLQDGNKRQAKANDAYYLLRKTACPTVIAECGFLSNSAEEALLVSEAYQEKVAEVLYLGIKQYRAGTVR